MTRTKIIAALCTIGLGLAAGSAEAKPFHGHGHSHGFGHGGVVLGTAVAATSEETYECVVKVRRTYDDFGNVYVRRVRVCD
ncbi:hypothetical protein ABZT49_27125 [Methylobacterium sp. EM32]|uniref:hypothetical protein n=1 Tax=Methylobacterium sp. EM32 TaxID=3163481 RepID=UPI0033A407B3